MQQECSQDIPGFGPIDRKGLFNEKLQLADCGIEEFFAKNRAEIENPKDVNHKLNVAPLMDEEEFEKERAKNQP